MSLYLGKPGRSLVRLATKSKCVGKAADLCGQTMSAITFGHYRTGLTRLAYSLSNHVRAGDKVTFKSDQAIKNGKVIAENGLLDIGRDMGEITIRNAFATPEGMAIFLRCIYLKPELWGINISDKFTPRARAVIKQEIDFVCKKMGIVRDAGLSVSVESVTLAKILYPSPFMFGVYSFALRGVWVALQHHDQFSALFLADSSAILLLVNSGSYYIPVFRKPYSMNNLFHNKATIRLNESSVVKEKGRSGGVTSHEFVHFLHDFGLLKNDIIANSVMVLTAIESSGCLGENDVKKYQNGHTSNPLKFIRSSKTAFWGELMGFPTSYTVGSRLAGLAHQLSAKMNDPEAAWRFLGIVGQYRDKDKLLARLQRSEFREFFIS